MTETPQQPAENPVRVENPSPGTIHKGYRIAIGLLLCIGGFYLRLLHTVYHKEGELWAILGEFGTFVALIIAVHFIYDLLLRDYEHRLFVGNMRTQIDKSLETFPKHLIAETCDKIKETHKEVGEMKKSVEKLGGALLHAEYMKVQDKNRPTQTTVADIYGRATEEVKKANETIDIFTSYLLEVDIEDAEAQREQEEYFSTLLSLVGDVNGKLRYRRIVQTEKTNPLETSLRERQAESYLKHILDMRKRYRNGQKVHLKYIDGRRPTTFVIIDNKKLLWQINQIGRGGKMEIYGMFIIEDPDKRLLQHFRDEFDHYWDGEAMPLN
jgi:hypothetical protein